MRAAAGWPAGGNGTSGMKSPIATALALVPAAALLLAARTAHSETWSGDDLVKETTLCALGRVNRAQADSRTCLACHDGTSAAGVAYQRPHELGRTGLSAMHTSHPVDVDYQLAWSRKPGLLHPTGALPEALALPQGKVSCTTCHDGASREKHHVSVSMSRSRLCASCHDI